ncbi:hypothetical protein CEXT_430281 [Caerostris extrusa]|uniref:Uncharacterized protein n=1 Tax=Caerostris extrusa TaxID=172846 RepID=A0AAV4XZE5_CAEEX|nr:hypothetical protein CEXT_430281 [Caerostris extrusa]
MHSGFVKIEILFQYKSFSRSVTGERAGTSYFRLPSSYSHQPSSTSDNHPFRASLGVPNDFRAATERKALPPSFLLCSNYEALGLQIIKRGCNSAKKDFILKTRAQGSFFPQ